MNGNSDEQRPLIKFLVTIDSPVSGLVGHVIRAQDGEAAALRALRSYPAGCAIAGLEVVSAEAVQ